MHVLMEYAPPAGVLSTLAARLWGEEPGQQIKHDLRRFKAILEADEAPTVEGQPRGRPETRKLQTPPT